jgi:aldehyde reductase
LNKKIIPSPPPLIPQEEQRIQESNKPDYFDQFVMDKIPTLKLSTGYTIPIFGLGTWKSKPGEVYEAVKNAITVGYRHIDCALVYGNEAEVGKAITESINEGTVTREQLFITSKLWNTFHSPELVVPSLKKSLTDLGITYLDMYLIHWPMGYQEGGELFPKDSNDKTLFSTVDFVDTWKGMEQAVSLGLVRSIGMSNFNKRQIERIWEAATIKPSNLQVECHPYLNQSKLLAYCKEKGIVMTGYSPLGSPDRPWAKPDDPKLLDNEKLIALGKKYNKSPAQIVLKWLVTRGVAAIPKTVSKHRLVENASIFDFSLSPEDMEFINTFDVNGRACHLSWNSHHPHFPFGDEY